MEAPGAPVAASAVVVAQEVEAPAARPAAVPRRAATLIDAVVSATETDRGLVDEKLGRFLRESSAPRALALWLEFAGVAPTTKDQVLLHLSREIARLDGILTRQVNAILHHPQFQKLEASWRGLKYLVEQSVDADNIKIRVLNISWKEIARDAERAIEFDQSQLFKKIYGEEFDTPGGEPYGLLIGDYEIRHRPGPDHPTDDLSVLTSVSHVAAAAFAPFVASADPALLGLDDFVQLERPLNLSRTFEQMEYLKWRAFRDSEDSRFVGLALPRVLTRLPYEDDGSRVDGFRFKEDVEGPDRDKYLWGNAAYAFASVVVRAFAQTGWLAEIRGVQRGVEGGGLVTGLPTPSFKTDRRGVAPRFGTEVAVTDEQEKELGELGFIPLCHCHDTEYAAFYGNQSVQKAKKFDVAAATINAKLSAMLQYMLCVSRFAHYVKVIGRDKVGSFAEADECENFLHRWLQRYVTGDSDASTEVKARYPLREASVEVRERPDKPGVYGTVMRLRPHYQLDEVVAAVRLVTELAPAR